MTYQSLKINFIQPKVNTDYKSALLVPSKGHPTYIAVARRHNKLCDLPTVDGERVKPGSLLDVPQNDGEVRAARQQVPGIVPRTLVERVQQTVHTALMA